MEPYLNDRLNLIKEAVFMFIHYNESERAQIERAQMERDARNKQELEYYTRINAATKEGLEKGLAEGLEKGREEGKEKAIEECIKTMHSNGLSSDMIARALSLDASFVESILSK